jgi:hypothetical protein
MLGGQIRGVVPWSRLFDSEEALLAINTDPDQTRTAWVTIDAELHAVNDHLTCVYSTDPAQIGQAVTVEARNRCRHLRLANSTACTTTSNTKACHCQQHALGIRTQPMHLPGVRLPAGESTCRSVMLLFPTGYH